MAAWRCKGEETFLVLGSSFFVRFTQSPEDAEGKRNVRSGQNTCFREWESVSAD